MFSLPQKWQTAPGISLLAGFPLHTSVSFQITLSRAGEPRGWDLNLSSDSEGNKTPAKAGQLFPQLWLCGVCALCSFHPENESLLGKLPLFWLAGASSCTCSQPLLPPWAQLGLNHDMQRLRNEQSCSVNPRPHSEWFCSQPEHFSTIRAGGGAAHTCWGTGLGWHGSSTRAATGDEVKVQISLILIWHPLQENGQREDPLIQNDLSESFEEEEVGAFLGEEEKLHLFDDLTKVNPVTTRTGEQPGRACWGIPFLLTCGSSCSHCINPMNTGVMSITPTSLSWSPHSLLNLVGNTPEICVTKQAQQESNTLFAKGADRRCCFSVLKCLQARYRVNLFYTNAGCSLVALNPFQPFSCLYSPELMREYHVALCPQVTLVFEFTVLLQSPAVKTAPNLSEKITPTG